MDSEARRLLPASPGKPALPPACSFRSSPPTQVILEMIQDTQRPVRPWVCPGLRETFPHAIPLPLRGRTGAGHKMARKEVTVASLLGSSEPMRKVRTFALTAARVNVPVLILGETGTGKSLLARVIHAESARNARPYQAINCAGIPDSLFESEFFGHHRGAFTGAREGRRGVLEQAHGGSVFLDEVGELSVQQQAKLLLALEEGEIRRLGGEGTIRIDVRLLAASARNLPREVRRGAFRRDLFYRLAVLTCCLPPLRSRREDIPVLARRFLRLHQRRHGGSLPTVLPEGLRYLDDQQWFGNVRELSHVLEAAIILSEGRPLDPDTLEAARAMGEEMSADASPGRDDPMQRQKEARGKRYTFAGSVDEERECIRAALERCRGNRSRAARELGMARNTLRGKLRKFGLD